MLNDARPVRIVAMSCCRSESAFSILVLMLASISFTELNTGPLGAACCSVFIAMCLLRARIFLAPLGQLCLHGEALGRTDSANLFRGGFGFFHSAAQKAGGFQVVFEEVALGVEVGGVQADGHFEILPCFGSVARRRERAGHFRAPAKGAAQP